MVKRILIIGLFVTLGKTQYVSAQPTTNAFDVASNYTGFSGNQGLGFGPWVVSTSGGGSYISSDGDSHPQSFGLWNTTVNGSSTALRTFNAPLAVGGSFSVQCKLHSLDNASKTNGFKLQDASGNVLFSFYYQGGDVANGHFKDASGIGTATGFTFNDNNFSTFTFALNSATTYTFTDNTTGASFSGTISAAPITQVTFFRANGSSSPSNGQDFKFDTLIMTSPGTRPIFTVQPRYQGGIVGSTITLGAFAIGSQPLAYQWYQGNAALTDATSTNLVLQNVGLASAGNYSVVASNHMGFTTSAVAVVTVYIENNRLLAYEGFNYSPAAISAQNGGSGWGGAWTNVAGNAMYINLESLMGGLNVSAGYDARSQGNLLCGYGGSRVGRLLDCSPNGVFAQCGYLDANGSIGADGKTIYVSFLQQPGVTTSFYEFEFHRGNFGDPGRIAGIGNDTANTSVNLRAPSATHTPIGPGDTGVDFYVVRIDFNSGNDDVRVYRNPVSITEPGTPTLTKLHVADMSFDRFCVAAWGNYLGIDEIRVGTTWTDAIGMAVSDLLPLTKTTQGWSVSFAATPGFIYHVMRAMSPTGPWTDLGTVTGPASGLGIFNDTTLPPSQAFYRTATYSTGDARAVAITNSVMIGQGIAEFVPAGFDAQQTPSLSLLTEPVTTGALTSNWSLFPQFSLVNGNACASLAVPAGTSLYGGGEVTGPLLRNGQTIELWPTDTGAWSTDNGRRLYQAHPWVLGVRPDGTAFGVIFDSSWKATLTTGSSRIDFQSLGSLFRVFIIDRASPQAVLQGLAQLTGMMPMPPEWALGYHQCRFSYGSATQVKQIADTFRTKQIPCDVIWMDIDYMNGYRDFTFNPTTFPDPVGLMSYLHNAGFRSVCILDPGVKVDTKYSVYQSGTANNAWVQTANAQEYHGNVWPGSCSFPDFTRPETRAWWAGLCQSFMTNGMDGFWTDMNEPSANNALTALNTMPYDNWHRGGGGLPAGSHLLYHNAYGMLQAKATYEGELAANPNRRPFVLSRANFLGGQRYATAWTGDNVSSTYCMTSSVPMSLTLGLSGQPFSGPDLGGFISDATADLWGNWVGFGAFLPFCRGHANAGTNQKEPWALGSAVENAARIALDRRYRLLPYFYTLFYNSSQTGLPVMQPVFFADPADLRLRAEQQAFLLGSDLLVIPPWAQSPALPGGIWQPLSLVAGDSGLYQAQLKIRGGAIIPVGALVQNTTQNSFDPLTLIVCLDANGSATGTLYRDAGDGWDFQSGVYCLQQFMAQQTGNSVTVRLVKTEGALETENSPVNVQIITSEGVREGNGLINSGVTISL